MKRLFLALFVLISSQSFAQNPTVVGDNILCPNSYALLTTQPYDTYQWFVRYFGSSTITPINGATSQTLLIDYVNYAASYLSVEVTIGTNDYISPEFFVDGYAFAGFSVASSGNFSIGSNGESILCMGDTMYFEILLPYDTNITWYLNGDTIPGMTSPILTVTTPGTYFVTGAPSVCPSFYQNPGLDLSVVDCTTGIENPISENTISAYPNPTSNTIQINSINSSSEFELFDAIGKRVLHGHLNPSEKTIDLSDFTTGIYYLKSGTTTIKIVRL